MGGIDETGTFGPERERPKGLWTDRVAVSGEMGAAPYAYRPGEMLMIPSDDLWALLSERNNRARQLDKVGPYLLVDGLADADAEAREMRRRGFACQPNYVYFTHCGGCCPPHPAFTGCGGGTTTNPVYPTPVYPTPVYPTPVYPTPVYPTPYGAHGAAFRSTGMRRSSARPAPRETPVAALAATIGTPLIEECPRVIVLDTGLAGTYPPDFGDAPVHAADESDVDGPDEDGNLHLDPAAGHGTFIAGLIEQVAPGCHVTVHRVFSTFGDSDEWAIAKRLGNLVLEDPTRTVINLSFGGYTLEEPQAMAWAVANVQAQGAVVVASAGNDGTCRPALPASLPGVVSVGAIGPNGPAPFSNYGPWVRACAPGVDLLSTFFDGYEGSLPPNPDGTDPDNFRGWALWSGTSFSAPVVAGALVRAMMADDDCSAQKAVERVIDAPSLMRIPNLGTVVNVI